MNGYGEFNHAKAMATYQGKWQDGKQHGFGYEDCADGTSY